MSIEFKIVVCKLFQFGRVKKISFEKGLNSQEEKHSYIFINHLSDHTWNTQAQCGLQSPHLKKYQIVIENTQCRVTKLIPNVRSLTYTIKDFKNWDYLRLSIDESTDILFKSPKILSKYDTSSNKDLTSYRSPDTTEPDVTIFNPSKNLLMRNIEKTASILEM